MFYASNGIGTGTQLAGVKQQFQQGNLNSTSNPLDLAIDGKGFFRLDDNGSTVYSRAGSFGVDRQGYIVNNKNQHLTGYQADATGKITDTLGNLQFNTSSIAPRVTSKVEYGLNLDAEAKAIDTTATPFDPSNADSYNFSTSVEVFDSLGVGHTLTSFYVRPDATTNDWQVNFTLDGGVPLDTSTTPPTPTVYGPQNLSFDNKGVLAAGSGIINLTGVATGNAAAPLDLNLDFTKTSQFGGQFSTQSLVQDGYATGNLTGVDVSKDGTVFGRYSNGQALAMGRVALVNFQNPQGLTPIGDTNWAESYDSGQPLVGAPGSGELGQVRSASLEGSNVEMTEQLVNMINAQRNFQANAQVISTADSMTQTIINLR
jgi:flagellar hook protein FlgE